MKTKALLYILAGLSVLVSCNKMSPAEQGADEKPGTTKILSLTAESEDMKTTLEKGSKYRILWDSDDEINLTDDTRTGTYEISSRSADYRTATFKHKEGSSSFGSGVKAFFPAGLAYTWPATQTISEHTTLSAEDGYKLDSYRTVSPLYGTVEGSRVLFKTLGSVLRIELTNNGGDDFTVSYVKVSAGQPLSGKFEIEDGVAKILPVTSGNISLENFNKTSMEPGEGQIILDCGNPGVTVASGDMAVFNIAVPAIGDKDHKDVENCKILFVDESRGKTVKLTASSTCFPYNNVARITATRTPSSEPGANCFIVEPGSIDPIYITQMGKYKGIKDNKEVELDGDAATWQSLEAGGVNGCKIVWETVNTVNAPTPGTIISSVSYSSGVLTVVPTGTPGNALVAVTTNADGTGDILWSYHIWVPKTSISTKSLNGVTLMDRNLGALTETGVTALGMQYQWGRKDPLLGFCTFDNIGKYVMNGVLNNEQYLPSAYRTITRTLTAATTNPDKWIYCKQGSWHSSWGSGSNSELIGLWGYDGSSNVTTTDNWNKKTIYDPCPVGYHVAGKDNFKTAFSSNTAELSNNMFTVSGVCFPAVGSMNNGSDSYMSYSTTKGLGVWTGVCRGSGSQSVSWNLSLTDGHEIGFADSGNFVAESHNVRCVKE